MKENPFGAFFNSNVIGVAIIDTTTSKILNVKSDNNQLQNIRIAYDGSTKVMTVEYAGQTWTKKSNKLA